MAEEKKPWFMAGDSEPDKEDEQPKFNAEEIEFESFMFDPGSASGPRQSAPLTSLGVTQTQSRLQSVQTAQATPPFTGGEVPRRDSSPLSRQSNPLLRDSGPLPRQSKPLTTSGSLGSQPQPSPMRGSSPLVDGRTSTGPILPAKPSSGSLQHDSAPLDPNPFVATIAGNQTQDTGPKLSVEMVEQAVGSGEAQNLAEPTQPEAPQQDTSSTHSGLMSRISGDTVVSDQTVFASTYHSGWSDSDLAAVEDFSAILLSLTASGPTYTPPADRPVSSPLPAAAEPAPPEEEAPTLATAQDVTLQDEPAHHSEEDISNFNASDLEFEGFMFDQGNSPEGALSTDNTAVQQTPPQQASGPLPFWLQNTGDLEAQPVAEYMDMIGVSTGSTEQIEAHEGGDFPQVQDAYNELYADLPPIEPFDFSSVELPEIEAEPLGFSAGELSGFEMPERSSTTATTDLQAVAALLDDDTKPDAKPPRSRKPKNTTAFATEELPTDPSPAAENTGWSVGMATGDLTEGDTEQDFSLDDMDVAPFNITELDLEQDDLSTGYLAAAITGPLGRGRGRNTGPLGANRNTGPLGASASQQEDLEQLIANGRRWPTGWLGDDSDAENNTAHDYPSLEEEPAIEEPKAEAKPKKQTKTKIEAKKRKRKPSNPRATRVPTDIRLNESTVDASPETDFTEDPSLQSFVPESDIDEDTNNEELSGIDFYELEDTVDYQFRDTEKAADPTPPPTEQSDLQIPWVEPLASVSLFSQSSEIGSVIDLPEADMKVEMVQVQPPPPPVASQSAAFPRALLASGPLPEIEGFDHLQEMVASNPDDIGAHLALAAAYAQIGDVATELRVYRRILRKSFVSDGIIRLIAEELADCEEEMSSDPYFHQVRGDLYMKQGRFEDAIAEYNKLA